MQDSLNRPQAAHKNNAWNLDSNYTSDWTTTHNLHREFLPFASAAFNPLTELPRIHTYLNTCPPTKKTISITQLQKDDFFTRNLHGLIPSVNILFQLAGSWPTPAQTHTRTEYVNPQYVHLSTLPDEYLITNTDLRIERIRTYATYGIYTRSEIAPQFGFTTSDLQDFINTHNIPWETLRTNGKQTTARTWETIHQWGYDYSEIATAFNRPTPTIQTTIDTHLDRNTFTAPTDPSKPTV